MREKRGWVFLWNLVWLRLGSIVEFGLVKVGLWVFVKGRTLNFILSLNG